MASCTEPRDTPDTAAPCRAKELVGSFTPTAMLVALKLPGRSLLLIPSVGSDVGGRRVWSLLQTRAALSHGGIGITARPCPFRRAAMPGGRTPLVDTRSA